MENIPGNDEEYIFSSPNYVHLIIEYLGKFNENKKKNQGVYITIINDEYAILSIKFEIFEEEKKINIGRDIDYVRGIIQKYLDVGDFKVIYLMAPELYTLQEISAVEASQVNILEANTQLNLNGKGVIVGIIDTGIDYLSEEFLDKDGKSRILYIWDQTIDSKESKKYNVPFGTVYNNEEINKAIALYKAGGNPYDIVATKDEYGHGTGMAGIVGASGKNNKIKGVAPECEFVIVKLSESSYIKKIFKIDVPVFTLAFIFPAIEYLKDILFKNKRPVVILLPLGSNNGNHKGNNIFDSFIESISNNVGIVVVTGAGNEGNKDGHASGVIKDKNTIETIKILAGYNQEYLTVEIWVDLPNIVDINLVSPSGEETGFIQGGGMVDKINNFIFEKTTTQISYYLPEAYTGEEKITISFDNLASGTWELQLKLREGEMAKYNAWLWQSGFVVPGTRFSSSDPYGTITVPGDSDFVITVAAYNQNNNNLLNYSGVSFRDEYIDKIDFAAGGFNTMTVGLNNTTQVISGTSLSAAIGAGACVLLFQWGIVQGNYPYMYSQSIKTFLRRGVVRRGKDAYPNPEWGYGIINFYKIFENML